MRDSLKLDDRSRVAVVGGGPAGSFFSYFLLEMAGRAGLTVEVDIYEPKDFAVRGPAGCNYCGGIVSESLVQLLALEGIRLGPGTVRTGIDSYWFHMDRDEVRISTPQQDKRIATIFRGAGPAGGNGEPRVGLDGYLQALTREKGARVIPRRVTSVEWKDGRPAVTSADGASQRYDLLAVACGLHPASLRMFQELEADYGPPAATKTAIREYRLGTEVVEQYLGSSMHVFLLDIPRLKFAAIIPKDDCVTVCLLGKDVDAGLLDAFFRTPAVRRRFPPDWRWDQAACQCGPWMFVRGAARPYGDRIVFIGDSGVSRLYKDGIGAAYRTAKAAATTAVFQGVSAGDFRRHYGPACKALARDNRIGALLFAAAGRVQGSRLAQRTLARMVTAEQRRDGRGRRMSAVLWDLFTGSAPYREILWRALHPFFVARLCWHGAAALWPFRGPVE